MVTVLALATARRSWSMNHTGNVSEKMREAEETLLPADRYMSCLGKEFESLQKKKLTDAQVRKYIELLLPVGLIPGNSLHVGRQTHP